MNIEERGQMNNYRVWITDKGLSELAGREANWLNRDRRRFETNDETMILAQLADSGSEGLRASDIKTSNSISYMISRLEKKGLIFTESDEYSPDLENSPDMDFILRTDRRLYRQL